MARYALVIGIANYNNFRNLPKAATDAEAIARLLEQHRYTVTRLPRKLVSENQWAIAPDKKLSTAELSAELKSFLRERATRQEVVIYFAGHGFRVTDPLTDEEVGYLATSDSTKDGQNAIRVDALNTLIGKSELGSLVMLLDCCYAGTLIEQRNLLQPTQGMISHKQNHCLIAACRDFERAREGEQHGIFTAAVLRGLSAENAVNGDITSADLLSFVSRALQPSGQEVIHSGMGQSIPLVAYESPQSGNLEKRGDTGNEGGRSPAEQCQSYDLAQKLKAWFETLGYRFESHEVWEANCLEWIINIPIRRNRYDRILVRGISGEAGLREIATLRQSVTQQRTDEGWLVTTRRISRAARDEVEKEKNQQLGCYTFDELLDQDADFSGYLTWLEAEIQKREIEHRYVPLACTKEEFDPDTKQYIGVSRYDERDGWIDGYIDLWLDDPAKEHLSMLGEFGTGKTWFAFHYSWKALQHYRDAQQRGVERPRLPLVIPLRDYAKAVSVESLFSEFFFRKHEIPIPGYTAFEQLNRMGKLLLIFDGFDEMAARVDRQQMINNFWELAKVVVPGAKVILTCRTEHFPEAKEGRALLNAELQASTKGLTGETPQFEVLELEKFDDNQIRQVLSLQTQPETVKQVMNNPQLLDLARRPVMTELILEALPDIEAGKPVDMSRVYLYAVRRKMERDIKAERTFTSLADKLYFLCELSWEMLSTDQMSLNYRQFPDRIRRLFGNVVQEEKDLDHWHYDMMSQTMLIRNADGDYMPAHRSLLEFFVAYKFAAELGVLASDFTELAQAQLYVNKSTMPQTYTWSLYFNHQLNEMRQNAIIPMLKEFTAEPINSLRSSIGQKPITKAVFDLLLPMINPSEKHLETLFKIVKSTQNKTESEVMYVGGNVATILVKVNQTALERKDLSHTVISNADFTTASLRHTNFTRAILKNISSPEAFACAWSIAFSPDGKFLASAHVNGEICLWKVTNWEQKKIYKGHTSGVNSVAFSPDSKTLVSGSDDRRIKIWNTHTGECLKTLQEHRGLVRCVAFSFDGKHVISTSDDNTVKLWDVSTGECSRTFEGHVASVRSVAFSPDGKTVISGSDDNTVKLWDVSTGECSRTFEGHIASVRSVAFNPTGKVIASGSSDGTVRLWDACTGHCFKTLKKHTERIRSIAVSCDGQMLASASFDNTIKLWNAHTGEYIKTLRGHLNWVRSVVFSPNSHILISSSDDQTVRVWSLHSGKCLKIIQGQTGWVLSVAFAPSGQILATSTDRNVVKIWNVTEEKCLKTLQGHTNWIESIVFSPDGQMIASGGEDQTVRLWNAKTGACIRVLKGHSNLVESVAFSPDSRILASCSDDQTIKLWDTTTGKCLRTLEGELQRICSIAFNLSGDLLLSGGSDRKVRLWNIITGKCLKTLSGHSDWITSVAFSPNGQILASGSGDKTIRIWDIKRGECSSILSGHTAWVWSVAFSSNGQTLASGSADTMVRLWNIKNSKCSNVLEGHSDWILSVAFAPDGKTLASGSRDETTKIWNIETGECIKTLIDRQYERMRIKGVKGLTEEEKTTLKALGVVED